mgnify:CR=1 FL=1
MEVLSQKDWASWTFECKCGLCESELKCFMKDIGTFVGDWSEAERQFYVRCMICSEQIILVTESLPKYVQITVTRAYESAASYQR